MKILFKIAFLLIIALFLEFLFHSFRWTPSFIFIIVIFIALRWRERAGAIAGFLAGFLYAGLFAEPPGLSALAMIVTAYLAGKSSPFLMDTPGAVLFVFAFIIFIVNDLIGSAIMSVFYSPFWKIRLGGALSGGLVFSCACNPLHRFFSRKRK